VLSQKFKNSSPPISPYLFGHFFLPLSALVTLELIIPPQRHYYLPPSPYHSLVHTQHTLPLAAQPTHLLAAQHTLPARHGQSPLRPACGHSCRWTTHTVFVSRSHSSAERKLESATLQVPALQGVADSSQYIKEQRCEVDHWYPSSAKVTNKWSNSSTCPYVFTAWTGQL
jgi:hypothetical protein